jgi:hypothetical protein
MVTAIETADLGVLKQTAAMFESFGHHMGVRIPLCLMVAGNP